MLHRNPFSLEGLSALLSGLKFLRPARPADFGAPAESPDASALAAFVGDFGGLIGGMEERFLPLGADLGAVVNQLQALTRAAGDGFSTIREEMSRGSLGELDARAASALSLLKQQLSTVAVRMQPLGQVAAHLHRLGSLGSEVKRIGSFLQACGSSFAVESARREESRSAFAAFVEELRGLATQIADLSERMQEESHATLSQLTAARRRMADDACELERLAHSIQGAFATASGEIQVLLSGLHTVLDDVEQHRAAITTQTGGVIFYLQFGDLVRQKCEHVLEAARETQAGGDAADSLPIVVRTVAAQLDLIQGEVDDARKNLAAGYAGLEAELGRLAACGQTLGDATQGSSGDAWSRLRTRLQDLERVQRHEARLTSDAVQTASEAGAAAAALHVGLGSVRDMSTHLHLLALNAIIQTAHLGSHGRTLEELAQHVDGLHRNCETLVPQILELLASIASRVATFTGQTSEPNTLDVSGLQQLERAQQGSLSVMQEVVSLAATSRDLIRGAISRLQTLDSLSAEIAGHRAALQEIIARLPLPRSQGAIETEADLRMHQRYTMQSERDAHQRARGLEPVKPVASDLDCLFLPPDSSTAGEELSPVSATAADDLGDNIELF